MNRPDEFETFYAAFFPGDESFAVMHSRDMCYLFRIARAAAKVDDSYKLEQVNVLDDKGERNEKTVIPHDWAIFQDALLETRTAIKDQS